MAGLVFKPQGYFEGLNKDGPQSVRLECDAEQDSMEMGKGSGITTCKARKSNAVKGPLRSWCNAQSIEPLF